MAGIASTKGRATASGSSQSATFIRACQPSSRCRAPCLAQCDQLKIAVQLVPAGNCEAVHEHARGATQAKLLDCILRGFPDVRQLFPLGKALCDAVSLKAQLLGKGD